MRLDYAVGGGRVRRSPIRKWGSFREGQVVPRNLADGQVELPAAGMGDSVGLSALTARTPRNRRRRSKCASPSSSRPATTDAFRRCARRTPRCLRFAAWIGPSRSACACVRRGDCRRCGRSCGAQAVARVIDAALGAGRGDALDCAGAGGRGGVLAHRGADARRRIPIVALVYRGPHQPSTSRIRRRSRRGDHGARGSAPAARSPFPVLFSRLDMTTASEAISGNRIEVELDNEKARAGCCLQSKGAGSAYTCRLHGARR